MLTPSFAPGPCHLPCGAASSRHSTLNVSAVKCFAGIRAHLVSTPPVPSPTATVSCAKHKIIAPKKPVCSQNDYKQPIICRIKDESHQRKKTSPATAAKGRRVNANTLMSHVLNTTGSPIYPSSRKINLHVKSYEYD